MNRRDWIRTGLMTVGGLAVASTASAQLAPLCQTLATPRQAKGPFYPVVDQLDTDADLVIVKGKNAQALGEVILIQGQVTDQNCKPVPGVLVEIWQACGSGRYDHPSDPNLAPIDPNFQYWGKAITNASGNYLFRTIQPGAYPASSDWTRPPHVHFKISKLGYKELITQMFFAGQEFNQNDLILQDLTEVEQKQVVVEFKKTTTHPHPIGKFDIQILKLIRK